MKTLSVVLSFIIFFELNLFTQNKFINTGPVLSIKAGYHNSYREGNGSYYAYSDDIPHGISLDGTIEIPTGKNWYIGFNYDISFGNETIFDNYMRNYVEREITIHYYSPIIKYRFFVGKGDLYTALGIGGSKVYYGTNGNSGEGEGMIMLNFRIGGDYFLNKFTMLSMEGVFVNAAQIDFGGSGEEYNFFQFKTGISYVFK